MWTIEFEIEWVDILGKSVSLGVKIKISTHHLRKFESILNDFFTE